MIAQPLPKISELADEINSYALKGRRLTNWQIRLLSKKANDLKGKIEESIYYDLLGSISGLANDSENVIKYYQTALKSDPDNFITQLNYLAGLNNTASFLNALEYGKKLLTESVGQQNITLLQHVIRAAFFSTRFQEASDFLSMLQTPTELEYFQEIINGSVLFKAVGITDNEAQNLHQLAFSIIPKMDLYFSGVEINIARNCIHYEIFVDLPVEDIFDVNWELAGAFVENIANKYNDVLMFSYSSVNVLDERRTA